MNTIGENVMVTGCNRGIGLELVKHFLSDGCRKIFACSRTMSSELEELTKSPSVFHILLEITSSEAVDEAYKEVLKVLGDEGLNILINNAAITMKVPIPSLTLPEDLLKVFNVNVVGTHSVTEKFAPLLIKAAENHNDKVIGCSRAFILNISSNIGSVTDTTEAWSCAYRISKAGLNMLTRCTAIELLDKGVLCCAVHPGWVKTDMGGEGAAISTETSVNDLIEILQKSGKEHSGLLIRKNMEVMPF